MDEREADLLSQCNLQVVESGEPLIPVLGSALSHLFRKDLIESIHDFPLSSGNDRKLKKISSPLPDSLHILRWLLMGKRD